MHRSSKSEVAKSPLKRKSQKSQASLYDDKDTVAPLDSKPANMKQFRASMAIDSNAINKQRATVANTIARASLKFQLKDETEQGSLVIENERLKTTIMVL